MISSGFVDLSPEQLPPTPLPLEHTVKDVHAVGPTRDQGKQNFGTSDAQFIINLNEISERARERGEQRRLRRLAALKTQATAVNPCEAESPGTTRALKPHPPPYTSNQIFKQPHPLAKLASDQPLPNARYQPNPHSTLTTPTAPHQISVTHEPHIPYSESSGELRRQFAVTRGLERECHIRPRESAEVNASLGRSDLHSDASVRVRGFRLHVEKLLQRVSAHRVQRTGRGSVTGLGSHKKVRFAPVVECFEF